MALLSGGGSLFTALWNNLTLLGFFLLCFALAFDFMKRRRRGNHPPGPFSLPFLGTMLHVDHHNPHLSFIKSPLASLSLSGLIMAKYNQNWKEQRRFTLSILRDFGMGKTSLEQQVIEEAGHLCSVFSAEEGHPFNPRRFINNAVSNVICSLTFGKRFDYKDQKFEKLLLVLGEGLKEEAGFLPQLLQVVPLLMSIPGLAEKVFQHQKDFLAYIEELLSEHRETWEPSYTRDITDAFLEEMEKRKDDVNSSFNAKNLCLVIGDLFLAGTETTSTTLLWGLLYMILYPNVQTKVHEEIEEVIGKNRPPKMEDQAHMHYTRAVIHEIQRFGNVVPAGVPHMTHRDTELGGFFISKGTTVIINLTSVLKDETMWEKPNEFYPENFLDKNGQFAKREAFLPFSTGRRVCLGEQLARMELFLFFTSLLQRFTFCIPKDQPRPRDDGCYTFTLIPQPYQIQAVPR
ncbi:hypothetical protein lerEdw1_003833 [Lerista edwardsae]|nr:hypothetical protein lerEdw1_003833 [Lerista edwardsae]